jgi:PTS system nitrogen regulatory IIA component
MDITDLIIPERVVCNAPVSSKKRALELLGDLIASGQEALEARAIFDSLLNRERLGSTGLGHGVALPHGRLPDSEQGIGAFLKLQQGIDFDAIDQQSVDLIFALLVPEHFTDEHLKILAFLAEMFSDRDFCSQLRAADSDLAVFELLTHWNPDNIDKPE